MKNIFLYLFLLISIVFNSCNSDKDSIAKLKAENISLNDKNEILKKQLDVYDMIIEKLTNNLEYRSCIFSEEKYSNGRINHSIVIGDSKFDSNLNSVNQDRNDYKCIYFSVGTQELKTGLNSFISEDGSFEGAFIKDGVIIDFKLQSPVEYYYNEDKLFLSGKAELYEQNSIIKSGEILEFCYYGNIKKGCFVDLWSNPAYQF